MLEGNLGNLINFLVQLNTYLNGSDEELSIGDRKWNYSLPSGTETKQASWSE